MRWTVAVLGGGKCQRNLENVKCRSKEPRSALLGQDSS